MIILNIHGYKGTAHNSKYDFLRKAYPEAEIISPAIKYEERYPNDIMSELETLVKTSSPDVIVGTSLGGFFACCLYSESGIRTILVNPAVVPFISIEQIEKENDGSGLSTDKLRQYAKLFADHLYDDKIRATGHGEISVILSDMDELLDHRITRTVLPSADYHVVHGPHGLIVDDSVGEIIRQAIENR